MEGGICLTSTIAHRGQAAGSPSRFPRSEKLDIGDLKPGELHADIGKLTYDWVPVTNQSSCAFT